MTPRLPMIAALLALAAASPAFAQDATRRSSRGQPSANASPRLAPRAGFAQSGERR